MLVRGGVREQTLCADTVSQQEMQLRGVTLAERAEIRSLHREGDVSKQITRGTEA